MKIGIALAGGGARGAAHVGILQALEENGIKADIYTGTSAGAIVASAKALGYTNRQMVELLKQINGSLLDIDYWGIIKGLFIGIDTIESLAKGKKLKKFLAENFSRRINEVKHPLGIVSTDINTGTQVIFASKDIPVDHAMDDLIVVYGGRTELELKDAIYHSATIPGVFPPASYNGRTLVDGCVVNNMPVNVAKAMGADKVIAIDLNSCEDGSDVQGILRTITRAISTMIDQNEDLSLSYMDECLVIQPEFVGLTVLDFDKAMEAYEAGYKYGLAIRNQVYDFLYEDA